MATRLRKTSRESVSTPDAREPLPLHPGARMTARVVLALALVLAALWTAAEFLPALLWAVILSISIWPLYIRAAESMSGGPSTLAALLFTLLVAVTIFVPIALATYQIAQQSDVLGNWVTQARENGVRVPDWVARLPIAAGTVEGWWRENLADPKSAGAWLQSINADKGGDLVKTFGGQLLHRAFMFTVALIALFVLLRNGRDIGRRTLTTADRLFGDPGEGLAEKVVAAVQGTVNGTVIVAVAEGLLIGAAYFLAGVPNATLLTILTMAFAMLPFGAWAAFSAAAVTLVVSGGSPVAALLVFAWGALVMLAGDHFVWPYLIGNAARLPFLFVFVGIFGGLSSFGLVGLFVGPVIMAAVLTIWREWVVPADSKTT
jgi:predicted PurR-regulated permease PerM